MPGKFRVDNGSPWGSQGDLPTDLVLWLAGLGVGVIANPPRRPQDNGVVERSQGTGKRWIDPSTHSTLAAAQNEADHADRRQREKYPHEDGKPRMEVYPELRHSGRKYSLAWERNHWSEKMAHDCLANPIVARQVDSKGLISLYNRNVYATKSFAGKTVYVRFDPDNAKWLILDHENRLLNQKDAPEASAANIVNLEVTHRRLCRKANKVDKLDVRFRGQT